MNASGRRIYDQKQFLSLWHSRLIFRNIFYADLNIYFLVKNVLGSFFNRLFIHRSINGVSLELLVNPILNDEDVCIRILRLRKFFLLLPDLKDFKILEVSSSIYRREGFVIGGNGQKKRSGRRLQIYRIYNRDSIGGMVFSFIEYSIRAKGSFGKMVYGINQLLSNKGVLGYAIKFSGPFKKSKRSKVRWIEKGKVSMNGSVQSVEYRHDFIPLLSGSIGVKIWISYSPVRSLVK